MAEPALYPRHSFFPLYRKRPICTTCGNIAHWLRLQIDAETTDRDTVAEWEDVVDTSNKCSTCAKLVEHFSDRKSCKADPSLTVGDQPRAGWPDKLEILRHHPSGNVDMFRGYATLHLTGPGPEIYDPPELPLEDSGSQAGDGLINTEKLKNWLQYCDFNHAGDCHSVNSANYFKRPDSMILIDLFHNNLIEIKQQESYATLSYVWGDSSKAFSTTQSNFADLSKEGGLLRFWDEFPATVKDAITLTKALAIRYLWIDRLSIIQDDEDSIEHNVSWMASIYANSYVTLIAGEGSDAGAGLRGIGTPDLGRSEDTAWRFSFPYPNVGYLAPMACEDPSFLLRQRHESRTVWDERGWTFQERALSRRCIIFHDGTVDWQCQKSRFKEYSVILDDLVKPPMLNQCQIQLTLWSDYEQYRWLCWQFSSRKVGNPEDTLNAFRSSTHALARGFPGGFVFALPELMFGLALTWRHSKPTKRRECFPSWSWLGWEGQIALPVCESRKEPKTPLEPEVYYQPMARWKKMDSTTNVTYPINDSYSTWQSFAKDRKKDLPDGWTVASEVYPLYKHHLAPLGTDFEGFRHPVPVATPTPIVPESGDWEQLLFGSVKMTHFRAGNQWPSSVAEGISVLDIFDSSGLWAGYIEAPERDLVGVVQGDDCEVLAICNATKNMRKHHVFAQRSKELQGEIPEWQWVELVLVMWIAQLDGIAYRRGIGEVWLSSWKTQTIKRENIFLG